MSSLQHCLLLLIISAGSALLENYAIARESRKKHSQGRYPPQSHFPLRAPIKGQVLFWEKVFYEHPSSRVLIHDSIAPEKIIDVIDFMAYARQHNSSKMPEKKVRDDLIMAYLNRYRMALKRFRLMGKKALRHGAIEQRIFSIYKKNSRDLSDLFRGKIQIRSQQGLADEFLKAAQRAQHYLPFMEDTFKREKVPPEITRLAFVESMFTPWARSKVGASGIWQFMPRTAKKYLRINRLIDERNSPYKSTIAAAKLLRDNYQKLQSWPLAITAYNHGTSGIRHAVRKTGSRYIHKIIQKYRSRSFGFASRNFYTEFIAAFRVYDHLLVNGAIKNHPKQHQNLRAIRLLRPMTASQILAQSKIPESQFKKLNPCIRDVAFSRYKHTKLPDSFELYLPESLITDFRVTMKLSRDRNYVAQ